jgi:hypothetical protein
VTTAGTRRRTRLPGPVADRPAFWALAAAAALGALVLGAIDREPFERFLGPIPAPAAVAVAAGAGIVALEVLTRRGWCPPRDQLDRRTAALLVGAAAVLAGAAISFDLAVPFDEDMNVTWPESMLFYPTMAFLAEVALHLVPLAILAATTPAPRSGRAAPGRATALTAIVAVATVEAGLQTASALAGPDRRAALFVAPHLVVIGVVELLGFRRNGFAALVTFRLTYYLLWHVVWGPVRLGLLF